jgi:hypothetical protein
MELLDLIAELGGDVEESREGVQWWSGPLPVFRVAAVGIGIKVGNTIFVHRFLGCGPPFFSSGTFGVCRTSRVVSGRSSVVRGFRLRAFSCSRFTKLHIISGATTVSRTTPRTGPQGGLHSLGRLLHATKRYPYVYM